MAQPRKYLDFAGRLRRLLLAGITVVALALVMPANILLAETPEVLVELDREQIFVGETVHYRVLLNHCGMQAEPDMSDFKQFDVRLVSRREIQTTQIIDDGRQRQRVVRMGPLYEYQLTPHIAGSVHVPAPSAEIDGKTYLGQTLTLKVTEIEDQDLVHLEMSFEPESVYPMQPFRLRLTLAVKGLPDPASETDPLKLRRALPSLTIPWADDEQLDDALHREPSRVGRNHKCADAAFLGSGGIGNREQNTVICNRCVAGPDLAAVDAPSIAVFLRPRADHTCVRTGVGLG